MFGVDYSFSRPAPACLAAHDVEFAVRYVGTRSSKTLTRGEADELRRHGVDLVAVYQTTASFMTVGADGAAAARAADTHARSCGMPADRPIYFALDVDPNALTAIQWRRVETFLAHAAGVLGRDRVGVYGGHAAIERLVPRHARWGWQTYAWSRGRWSEKAHLEQYRNGVAMCGGEVDLCRSRARDFGQWDAKPPGRPAPTKTQEVDMLMVRNPKGSVLLVTGSVSLLVVDPVQLKRHQAAGIKLIDVSADQFSRYERIRVA